MNVYKYTHRPTHARAHTHVLKLMSIEYISDTDTIIVKVNSLVQHELNRT